MNFYCVKAKCGHVGNRRYIPISFAVKAHSKEEAKELTRTFPRVKHNKEDAIIHVREVDYGEFLNIIDANENDPYLKAKTQSEISFLDLIDRIKEEPPAHVFGDCNKAGIVKKIRKQNKANLQNKDYNKSDSNKAYEICQHASNFGCNLESMREALDYFANQTNVNIEEDEDIEVDEEILNKYLVDGKGKE